MAQSWNGGIISSVSAPWSPNDYLLINKPGASINNNNTNNNVMHGLQEDAVPGAVQHVSGMVCGLQFVHVFVLIYH